MKFLVFTMLLIFMMYPAFAEAQVFNRVVAVVNDEIITQQDIDQLLSVMYAQYVHSYSQDELLVEMENMKKDILKRMIEDKLILSRGRELEIKISEDEIEQKLDKVKSSFETEEEFLRLLETQGITISDLKTRYRDQILMQKVVDLEVRSRVNILPSEVSAYYEEHREEFKKNEQFKIRHILIKAKDDIDFELIRIEAEEVYDELEGGADFTEVAKEYSEGPNKEQGGDMGYISLGDMIKEIDDILATLSVGEISKPIKSKIGYHIIKLEDTRHSGYSSIEDVTLPVRRLLFQTKFKKEIEKWISGLRTRAFIEIKQ